MIALTGQKFGKRPSQLLRIRDEVLALDFDQAAALRLQEFEDERERERIELMALMMGVRSG